MFTWIKNLFGLSEASGERARNKKGQFKKDDKSTPNVNEAYADGKTPKRKPRKVSTQKRGRPRKQQK